MAEVRGPSSKTLPNKESKEFSNVQIKKCGEISKEEELRDVQTKLLIASIADQVEREQNNHQKAFNTIERAKLFTKLPVHIIQEIEGRTKPVANFSNFMIPKDFYEYKTRQNIYLSIRKCLVQNYIIDQTVPTFHNMRGFIASVELLECLSNKIQDLEATSAIAAGLVWQSLPNTKKYIPVEKPVQTFERFNFLKQMKQYRLEHTAIIYIEKTKINDKFAIIAASPQIGFINLSFDTTEFKENKLITFIKDCVVPYIPKKSVIVLDLDKTPTPVPNIYSSKNEIISWLKEHDLPFKEPVLKADLLTIMKKYKGKPHTFDTVDQFILGNGFHILRRPFTIPFPYFKIIWEKVIERLQNTSIHNKLNELKFTGDFLKLYALECWTEMDQSVVLTEEVFLEEDLEMEDKIDKLIAMAKDGGISEEECSDLDDKFSLVTLIIPDFVILE